MEMSSFISSSNNNCDPTRTSCNLTNNAETSSSRQNSLPMETTILTTELNGKKKTGKKEKTISGNAVTSTTAGCRIGENYV